MHLFYDSTLAVQQFICRLFFKESKTTKTLTKSSSHQSVSSRHKEVDFDSC